jgi:hypothetical protein
MYSCIAGRYMDRLVLDLVSEVLQFAFWINLWQWDCIDIAARWFVDKRRNGTLLSFWLYSFCSPLFPLARWWIRIKERNLSCTLWVYPSQFPNASTWEELQMRFGTCILIQQKKNLQQERCALTVCLLSLYGCLLVNIYPRKWRNTWPASIF